MKMFRRKKKNAYPRKKLLYGAIASLMVIANVLPLSSVAAEEQHIEDSHTDSEWNLVWEDEFDGDQLDTSKWNYDIGNGFTTADGTYVSGWGNQELQFYQKENVSVKDGKLIIEARKESVSDDHGVYDYTSGKIHTKGKFFQKYGKFEAKIKLPEGKGYWPAFWMMPEKDVYGGWAASGEIDIMEAGGSNPTKIGGAIHYGSQWPNNTYTAKDYHFPAGQSITEFNTYTVEWEPGEIRWYVNGQLFQKLNNWYSKNSMNAAKYAYPAPFDQPFYLILNLAVGGWYDGNPNEDTIFPGKMEVDYVRVYEKSNYRDAVEPSFESETLPEGAKEAVNGNYVYDPGFEGGFAIIENASDLEEKWNKYGWNLVYLNDFHGQASATVEQIDGTNFAKIDITRVGSQPYSVQLIQNVTIAKGRWYKLHFQAKSTTARKLNVKIGGGADRGYSAYSPSKDFDLTDSVQSYDLIFQMQAETDLLARLEFNMGLNGNSVWIGNVVLEEIEPQDPYNEDGAKKPLPNGNHVYNGTFDQGRMDRMTYWDFDVDHAIATAHVDEQERMLHVNIENGGESHEAIKLSQKGISLGASSEYKLSFRGKSAGERSIIVALTNADGSVEYARSQITLTDEITEKQFIFKMPDVSDSYGKLVFYLGGESTDVFLDDIELIRLSNADFSLGEIFPLKNGDFSNVEYK
ncbi:family 16 glycosylhydrolase, partial [Anoxybacillus ayderensis]|uniref:family 16 glycosylhydrolase n=1 Tax=Anoxybacillus ayderensis TaxID=265546 RepID=UPI000A27ABCF